jgi:alpha-beta hydrolase superfamily lysophospholipase
MRAKSRYDESRMIDLLDHPALSSAYFFPRRSPVTDPFWVASADGGARLACYRSAPFSDALTVIHFHGNAEVVADYVPAMARIVNHLGANVLFAEYRGYGNSTGTASLGKMLEDVKPIVEAAAVPEERLVFFGRSLGSVFAIEAAALRPAAAGLVIESGIADPLERTLMRVSPESLGTTADVLERVVHSRVDQKAKLHAFRGPLLVMHTVQDPLIPVSHGSRIYAWGGAEATEKELVLFEQGDHGTIFPANRDAYVGRLGAFLQRAAARAGIAPQAIPA